MVSVLNLFAFGLLATQVADAAVNFRGADRTMIGSLTEAGVKLDTLEVDWGSLGLGVGIGAVLVGAIAALVLKVTSSPEPKSVEEEASEEPEVTEVTAEDSAAAEQAEKEADVKASNYQKLMRLLVQKAAQEVGPKFSKAAAIKSTLESRLISLPGKVKALLINEAVGTAGSILASEACPEAMLLFDLDKASGANFPPTPVLIAGALSPAILGFMAVHHALQLVTVGLPVFILCLVAIMVDSQAPCPGIPSLVAWIWTQTFLAVCLVIGHAALLLKIFLGKKKLAAKAQELQDKNDGNDNTRDEAVGGMILLQEALLVEADIRGSVWTSIVGVATCVWLVTGFWNIFLSARYTFVPGVVAFHPGAAKFAPESYCGAWMTIIVLNISLLLTMLYLIANVLNVGQWICNLMVENQGFQQAVIQQGRNIDGQMPVPMVELLMKAFLLRGTSDTVNARIGVVQSKKALLEKDLAEMEAKTAALDKDIVGVVAQEDALKAEAKEKGIVSEGNLASLGMGKMEDVSNEEMQAMAADEAEMQAKALKEETDKGIEDLMGMMNAALEAAKAKAAEAARLMQEKKAEAEALAKEAYEKANDPEFQKQLQEQAKKKLQEAQAAAEQAAEQAKSAADDAAKQAQATIDEAAKKAKSAGDDIQFA